MAEQRTASSTTADALRCFASPGPAFIEHSTHSFSARTFFLCDAEGESDAMLIGTALMVYATYRTVHELRFAGGRTNQKVAADMLESYLLESVAGCAFAENMVIGSIYFLELKLPGRVQTHCASKLPASSLCSGDTS